MPPILGILRSSLCGGGDAKDIDKDWDDYLPTKNNLKYLARPYISMTGRGTKRSAPGGGPGGKRRRITPAPAFTPTAGMFCTRCFRKVPGERAVLRSGDPPFDEQMQVSLPSPPPPLPMHRERGALRERIVANMQGKQRHMFSNLSCRTAPRIGAIGDIDPITLGTGLPNRSGWLEESELPDGVTLERLREECKRQFPVYIPTFYLGPGKPFHSVWRHDPNNEEENPNSVRLGKELPIPPDRNAIDEEAAPGLDTLPAEIILMICEQFLHSPDDFRSLTQVSRALREYALPLTREVQILTRIIRRTIEPGAMRTALVVLYGFPAAMGPNHQQVQDPPQLFHVEHVMNAYFLNGALDLPIDAALLRRLSRLCTLVIRFTVDYATRALSLLAADPDPSLSGTPGPATWTGMPRSSKPLPTPLSSTERTRLQRGFLRYELFCRLFPAHDDGVTSAQQYLVYIRRMEPWEVEEIACAQSYFQLIANGMIYDVASQITAAVRNSPGTAKRRPNKKVTDEDDVRWVYIVDGREQRMIKVTEDTMALYGMGDYTNNNLHDASDLAASLAGYGMVFVNSLCRSSETRLEMVRTVPAEPCNLSEALQWSTVLVHPRTATRIRPLQVRGTFRDDALHASLGYTIWEAVQESQFHRHDRLEQPCSAALRDWGYVIWDQERFDSLNFEQRMMTLVEQHWAADYDTRPWTTQGGPETSLDGVWISETELERIGQPYIGPFGL